MLLGKARRRKLKQRKEVGEMWWGWGMMGSGQMPVTGGCDGSIVRIEMWLYYCVNNISRINTHS